MTAKIAGNNSIEMQSPCLLNMPEQSLFTIKLHQAVTRMDFSIKANVIEFPDQILFLAEDLDQGMK